MNEDWNRVWYEKCYVMISLYIIIYFNSSQSYWWRKQESQLHKVISSSPCFEQGIRFRVMVFNATFNNISVISWRSVFLGTRPYILFSLSQKSFFTNHPVVYFLQTTFKLGSRSGRDCRSIYNYQRMTRIELF
jgi:hypothetical protein